VSTQVTFYAVQSAGVSDWAAKLVESAVAKDRRALVFCSSSKEAASIDEHLWTFKDDTFIPHEVYDELAVETQRSLPVLVTTTEENTNGANILIQLGRGSLEFGLKFDHVIELVDRADTEELQISRERYKAWKKLSRSEDVSVSFKG